MEPRIFFSTFLTVLLLELGDKTELATVALSTSTRAPWTVFAGSAAALVLASALAAFGGDLVARNIPATWIHRLAGCFFLVIGVLVLWRSAP